MTISLALLSGEMAWEARSGLKHLSVSDSFFKLRWRNGLGSPFGFETQKFLERRKQKEKGEMAWEARSGLKHRSFKPTPELEFVGEMAWEARSGLKRHKNISSLYPQQWRNGL